METSIGNFYSKIDECFKCLKKVNHFSESIKRCENIGSNSLNEYISKYKLEMKKNEFKSQRLFLDLKEEINGYLNNKKIKLKEEYLLKIKYILENINNNENY